MNGRVLLVIASFVLSVATGLVLGRGSSAAGHEKREKVLIGLSLDTLKEARWQGDRDMFVHRAQELGASVLDLSANSDDTVQIGDVEKLITNKVDVLVIVPHDGKAMAKAVRMAHEAGIPVIAYDRLIRDSDLDLYVSFDNVKVGSLQAQYLVDHLPTPGKGKIVRIYGSKTDNNAALFKQGQDRVLEPYIKRGDIVVVHEDWADDWKPENAKRIMNAAITSHGGDFDAVLASNDGTAGGAVQALVEEGLAGKKLVTGQDAELVACQRIAAGTQAMTIYKPLKTLARNAAEMAVGLARRKVVIARDSVDNGKIQVPSALSEVMTVTRDNLVSTVIADGFHSYDDVYRGVPDSERPKRP
ncbi:MAG TPA: substrate-binding domain-containing protein [Polyangiaceae bacterium]|jgi:D-xylose transport system substrate-binding protein